MNKKILIYASDNRGYNEVKNVVNELSKQKCDYVFIYPINNNFTFESNIDYSIYPNFESKSIGFTLPFKPDILLITRESWAPETNLIIEFKQAGAIVCNLENSSWLYNNIKTRLEIHSRMKFPTNLIDIFFDHSEHTYQTKLKAGWINYKTKIVGIPKFDYIQNVNVDHIEDKYNITKPIIVVYGSMESNIRPNIINVLKEIKEKYSSTHHLFYKPHPNELVNFPQDFNNNIFTLSPSFTVILNEEELAPIAKLPSIHIGILTSVMYYALIFNKPIFYIKTNNSGVLEDLDIEKFQGHEYNFWAPLINVNTWDEFTNKIGLDKIKIFKENYLDFQENFKNTLKPYESILYSYEYDNKKLLKYYDEYSDGESSKRITEIILNLYK